MSEFLGTFDKSCGNNSWSVDSNDIDSFSESLFLNIIESRFGTKQILYDASYELKYIFTFFDDKIRSS